MSSINGPHEGKARQGKADLKAYKDNNSGPATATRGISVTASALEKPGTWVRLPASVRFLFVPLRPFFYAALAKRWKGQFRQG